jgi:hypothetical protein
VIGRRAPWQLVIDGQVVSTVYAESAEAAVLRFRVISTEAALERDVDVALRQRRPEVDDVEIAGRRAGGQLRVHRG